MISNGSNLRHELAAAADRVHGSHLGLLAKAGITRRTLFDFEAGIGGRFGLHSITTFREGTFELAGPDDAGQNALVIGADLLDVGLEDLVAWYPLCNAPGSLDTSLSHAAGLIEIAACHA